jgi:uncharacterized protein (DUF1330 family)
MPGSEPHGVLATRQRRSLRAHTQKGGLATRSVAAMPAYVIVETDVTDPERYEQYKAASPAAIAAGGGRFLVRGGDLAVLEGDWHPSRLVMLEFEDLATAKRWYESEVYQQTKKLREGAAHLRVVAVQGVE